MPQRSEDSTLLLGKAELLQWAAATTGIACSRYNDLRDGLVLLALAHELYPLEIPFALVHRQRRGPRDAVGNWRVLHRIMTRHGIPTHLTRRPAVRAGHSRPCFNSLVVFYFLLRLTERDAFSVDFAAPVDPSIARFLQSPASRVAVGQHQHTECSAQLLGDSTVDSSLPPPHLGSTSPSPPVPREAEAAAITPRHRSHTASRTPSPCSSKEELDVNALRAELAEVRAAGRLFVTQQRERVRAELARASHAFQSDLEAARRDYFRALRTEQVTLRQAYASLAATSASGVESFLEQELQDAHREIERLQEALEVRLREHGDSAGRTGGLLTVLTDIGAIPFDPAAAHSTEALLHAVQAHMRDVGPEAQEAVASALGTLSAVVQVLQRRCNRIEGELRGFREIGSTAEDSCVSASFDAAHGGDSLVRAHERLKFFGEEFQDWQTNISRGESEKQSPPRKFAMDVSVVDLSPLSDMATSGGPVRRASSPYQRGLIEKMGRSTVLSPEELQHRKEAILVKYDLCL